MAAVSVEEQWSYIKIEYLRGKSGKEIMKIYVRLVEIMHCLLRQSTGG